MRIRRSKAADHTAPAPIFVLVDPQMGENIGASARAMLNFGVTGLRLVRPRDGWPNPKASAMAAGAAAVIDGVAVFETVEDAVADCSFVAATTARRRELSLPVISPQETATMLAGRVHGGERCAVLFGGERSGLSSDDVAKANVIVSIPVNPAFASLNLAQATMIVAYEWSRASEIGFEETVENPMEEQHPASREDIARLYEHVEKELDARGYFFPPQMRATMARNLRVALSRGAFTQTEARTLRGVVKALARPISNEK